MKRVHRQQGKNQATTKHRAGYKPRVHVGQYQNTSDRSSVSYPAVVRCCTGRIGTVQIQPGKPDPDHADDTDDTAPTRQRELVHTDQDYSCPERSAWSGNTSYRPSVRGVSGVDVRPSTKPSLCQTTIILQYGNTREPRYLAAADRSTAPFTATREAYHIGHSRN